MPQFTPEQMRRYERHFSLDGVGFQGQLKLRKSKVLVVGAGGLGSPALLYLAAAGIGRIGIADGDTVDLSNLQRQIAHSTPDIGKAKTQSAKEKIAAINPNVQVIEYGEFLNAANIARVFTDYDFIVEGSDNFATKFLVNDACVLLRKPFSHAGMLRYEGQTLTVLPGKSRCYRCLFRDPPPPDSVPNCAEAGILGMLPGILGSIQAAEAVKYLLGLGELLTDRLLIFDALSMRFREIKGQRDPECPACGEHATLKELRDYPADRCGDGLQPA
jgi:molybdopterin/thiamine biosynthesis adenylyltransferase